MEREFVFLPLLLLVTLCFENVGACKLLCCVLCEYKCFES